MGTYKKVLSFFSSDFYSLSFSYRIFIKKEKYLNKNNKEEQFIEIMRVNFECDMQKNNKQFLKEMQ